MLTYHASSVSDAESDIFCLLYCMNLSYCHIYNRTSWHTADCILKYAVLRILSEDTPSGRLYSIFRISYYSMLLSALWHNSASIPALWHIRNVIWLSYIYRAFLTYIYHISQESATTDHVLPRKQLRATSPSPAMNSATTVHVLPRKQVIRIMWVISGLPWPGICNPPSCFYGFHPGLSESYLNCLNAVRSQGRIPIRRNLPAVAYYGAEHILVQTDAPPSAHSFKIGLVNFLLMKYDIWYIFQETGRQYLSALLYPQDLISGRSHSNAMK